ncbi:MAG: N-acetylglucosamine-6-phosphate deacetylase [Clostridiales bacterium]|nr:N-acetylglucosamine-6-phosphate deacetylase [Clostridiales bacterium]
MIIKGAKVFCDDGKFKVTDVLFDERIQSVGHQDSEGIDASGHILIPGLIDIHTHGAMGVDTCDGDSDKLEIMSKFYVQNGITSFCATTMSYDEVFLAKVMKTTGNFSCADGAKCVGINMEGPFINPKKKGAQADKNITNPDYSAFERLFDAAKGKIRTVDIAPELPGSMEFIRSASEKCTVSLAHTDADYDQAMEAFATGATHVTHLFNAMPPFLHRSPGVVGAAADSDATVELICDGIHLHPAVIRAMFKLFNEDHICLISDSMRSTGLPDGDYELGGQQVFVRKGKATLHDGTIAGSTINLMTAVKNVISYGIAPESALIAATSTPARVIGAEGDIGSITPGKCADLVLLDDNWNIKKVFVNGREMR